MDLPSLESSIQLSPGALLGWQGDISYLGFPAWTSRSLSPSPNPVTFQASFYLVEYSVISTPLDIVKQSSNLHGCTLRTFPVPCPLPPQLWDAVAPVRTPSCSHLTYSFSHKTIPGVPFPRLWGGGPHFTLSRSECAPQQPLMASPLTLCPWSSPHVLPTPGLCPPVFVWLSPWLPASPSSTPRWTVTWARGLCGPLTEHGSTTPLGRLVPSSAGVSHGLYVQGRAWVLFSFVGRSHWNRISPSAGFGVCSVLELRTAPDSDPELSVQ